MQGQGFIRTYKRREDTGEKPKVSIGKSHKGTYPSHNPKTVSASHLKRLHSEYKPNSALGIDSTSWNTYIFWECYPDKTSFCPTFALLRVAQNPRTKQSL
jgi:hypothetical protein